MKTKWIRRGKSKDTRQRASLCHQTKRKPRRKSRRGAKPRAKRTAHTTSSDFKLPAEDAADFEASGPHAYDKADWHLEGEFPEDLPDEQANVHTGMFVRWLIDHDMIAGEFRLMVSRFKRRGIPGSHPYATWGGALTSDMLTEEGNQFASEYYDGKFGDDYGELLVGNLPSFYHVADTRENYEKMKQRIDKRYQAWKKERRRG